MEEDTGDFEMITSSAVSGLSCTTLRQRRYEGADHSAKREVIFIACRGQPLNWTTASNCVDRSEH